MRNRARALWLLAAVVPFLLAHAASAVTIEWVTVGDSGNTADTELMSDGTSGYGAVPYAYQIAKYETTNAQYAEFLNAVAVTDTNVLYSTSMASSAHGGITRSGSSGSYTYSVKAGREQAGELRVVLRRAALRELAAQRPATGAQGIGTTEDGAYTITAAGIGANRSLATPDATIFLTSEDEWYKAAYYDAASISYFNYPSGLDTQPTCSMPGDPEHGELRPCGRRDRGQRGSTQARRATSAPSTRLATSGSGTRPSSTAHSAACEAGVAAIRSPKASIRDINSFTALEEDDIGFRVASIPEPGTGLLGMTGLLGLACRQRCHVRPPYRRKLQ